MANNNGARILMADDPCALARFDAGQVEAWRRMTRHLSKYPHPTRWSQLGHTNFPNRMGGRMTIDFLAAGGDPHDAEIPWMAALQWVRSFRAGTITPADLRLVSCREETKNFKVNGHQVALTGHESVENLRAFEFDVAEQIAALVDVQCALALAIREKQADDRQNATMRRVAGERVRQRA